MFNPTFWALTQPLGLNNPIAGFVLILPSAGLYLTQHFLECNNDSAAEQIKNKKKIIYRKTEIMTMTLH